MKTLDEIVSGQSIEDKKIVITTTGDELLSYAGPLLNAGFRVALIAGHDDGDQLRAVYLFTTGNPDRRVEVHVPLEREAPSVPSLAALSFPAGRFEREMRDLYGIVPQDHPLPRRLVRHFHWPKGWYPMLTNAGTPSEFPDVDGPYPFRTVSGNGVSEIPVGPVHAGMIGPGHFRFSVVGETILKLKARLWFVHRGIEKHFQGRSLKHGVELAERISGDTSVGHSLAFCQAVEDAHDIPVSLEIHQVRALLLELERVYNHVADIGALCNDVAHGILDTQAQRIREDLLRINDQVTGHRLLRGAVCPGGTAVKALPDLDRLDSIRHDIEEVVSLALRHTVVQERFMNTSILSFSQAAELGALGYVARASGLTGDARYDHPTVEPILPRVEHSRTGGDVLARFLVRAEEINSSIAMISRLINDLSGYHGKMSTKDYSSQSSPVSGVGIVEGWRGTIVHRVECAEDGTLMRVKVVDPSFFNWPALPVALSNTIVPDFPLTNKSFNLSYAGNDL